MTPRSEGGRGSATVHLRLASSCIHDARTSDGPGRGSNQLICAPFHRLPGAIGARQWSATCRHGGRHDGEAAAYAAQCNGSRVRTTNAGGTPVPPPSTVAPTTMPDLHRVPFRLAALLATATACYAAPATSAQTTAPPAATGGASIPTVIAPSTGGSGYGEPGRRSVRVAPTAVVGEVAPVRGTLPGGAHRRVVLQRLDPRRGWRNVARARVRSTQRYLIRWRPDRSGRITLRVAFAKRASAQAAEAAPVAVVNVYRPAMATFFGPGLYGNPTYCGQVLTSVLHGVAHRKLPCGTPVAIMYERREIVVPVVDRGPFNPGFDWDLTQATADALGFRASGEIGYARVAAPAPR
jgi:rare lipoprotein A